MAIEFESFGKIPRLFRDVVVTEKIDGTNGAIGIVFQSFNPSGVPDVEDLNVATIIDRGGFEVNGMVNIALVYAQSRNRIISPKNDNHGFANWVHVNAESLVSELGEGLHFGEWWGSGIQRGYSLGNGDKRFSLFNVKRWEGAKFTAAGLDVVPVIERGEMSTVLVRGALNSLQCSGSLAAPGFMKPEGVVIYHTSGNTLFKATIENDEAPKSKVTALSANAVFAATKLIGDHAA